MTRSLLAICYSMAPSLLPKSFHRYIADREYSRPSVGQSRLQSPLSHSSNRGPEMDSEPHHVAPSTLTSVSIAPASAPSSLVHDISGADHLADVELPGKISPPPHSIVPDQTAYTYNIPRTALEQLLSTEAESFVATSSSQGLTLSPSWRHGGEHHLSKVEAGWRQLPTIAPVVGVVMLWMCVTWYGRRKKIARRTVTGIDEKGWAAGD